MESIKTEDFKALQIIVYALMAGLTLFCLVVIFLISGEENISSGPIFGETMDLGFVSLFAIVCATLSRFIYGKLLNNLPREERQDYGKAFNAYRSANIVRYALLEGPGMLACVITMLTGNTYLLLIVLFLLMMMWLARPTETAFAEWRG